MLIINTISEICCLRGTFLGYDYRKLVEVNPQKVSFISEISNEIVWKWHLNNFTAKIVNFTGYIAMRYGLLFFGTFTFSWFIIKMKVVKVISDLNDLQIWDMLRYFNRLRWFRNIHFCAVVNVVSTQRLYSVFYDPSWKMLTGICIVKC